MSTDFRTLKFKGADILSWIDEHVPGFVNTYDVCTYLKQNGKYIALELHAAGKSYKDNNEYTVVTYPWSYELRKVISSATQDYLWIDIVNINQNAKDVNAELSILPSIYKNFDRHFIISFESFFRGWCLFEICTANEDEFFFKSELTTYDGDYNLIYNDNKIIDNKSAIDFVVEKISFNSAKFSFESDRNFVKEAIVAKYETVEKFDEKLQMILEFYVGLFTRGFGNDDENYDDKFEE